jgi:hypothetical protein
MGNDDQIDTTVGFRPSSVSLLASGRYWEYPAAEICVGSKPYRSMSNATTSVARAVESSQFDLNAVVDRHVVGMPFHANLKSLALRIRAMRPAELAHPPSSSAVPLSKNPTSRRLTTSPSGVTRISISCRLISSPSALPVRAFNLSTSTPRPAQPPASFSENHAPPLLYRAGLVPCREGGFDARGDP